MTAERVRRSRRTLSHRNVRRSEKKHKSIVLFAALLISTVLFLCACGDTAVTAEGSGGSTAPSQTEETAPSTAETQDDAAQTPSAVQSVSEAPDEALSAEDSEEPSEESSVPNTEEEGDDGISVGLGPGPATDENGYSWTPGTIYAPGAVEESGMEESGSQAFLSVPPGSAEGYIDIEEGPEGAQIPLSGEIPTAASFTVFNEDHTISHVVPEPLNPYEYIRWTDCRIEDDEVVISGMLEGSITPSNTLMGQDTSLYLLELEPWEDSINGHRYIAALPKNAADLTFRLPLNANSEGDRLYHKYVACVWVGDHYVQVSEQVCVSNPESIAEYTLPYTEPLTKKGLLIEKAQIADAFDLGVCNVIINIPFNHLLGEGIEYDYDGEIWHFNRNIVETYDHTISAFSNKSMNVSVVLLNGYNAAAPDFFYPGTTQNPSAKYYQFNASTREGCSAIKAVASFLAVRYNGLDADHGKVQNWIIGNEINNQEWNWLGPMPMADYVREYERSFRLFYNAIRSSCANDRVFFSLDHNWNRDANGRTRYNARDVLEALSAEISRHGNIDWGLAYHPYSEPMTEPEFWDDFNTGKATYYEDSPVVNFANLSLLTEYMQRPEMRDREGSVRHIILSEEGFTSMSATRGEVQELQAAAFAYAYYIADSNPYIDAFILSRQVDAPSELRSSLAFGLWTTSSITDANIQPAQKKYIWEVFKNIDRRSTTLEYSAFAKEILGIERWSDVIPGFRWAGYEN